MGSEDENVRCLLMSTTPWWGYALAQLVEALRYKRESRGFDFRWCHWHISSGLTMVLRLTQHLTEMSTKNISWQQRRPVRTADNLTTFMYWLSWNLGASTSWKPQGLSRPVMGLLYLCCSVTNFTQSSTLLVQPSSPNCIMLHKVTNCISLPTFLETRG